MDIMTSPYKTAKDSPSRQLLYELSRLGISTQEKFYARLDEESREREALHTDALAASAAEHARIRRRAEAEREKLELQLQEERRRRDEEDRKELERRRQEKADQEIADKRREIERAKAAELEEKRAVELRRSEAAAAEAKKAEKALLDAEIARRLKDAQDAEAQKKEAARQAGQKTREAAIAARNPQTSIPAPRPTSANNEATSSSQSTPQISLNPAREAEHHRYLEIHRNLKNLRKVMMTEAGKRPDFKARMGDMRREIVKCVGQLTIGKGANRAPLAQLIAVLREALKVPEPKLALTMFLASPPQPLTDTQAPALLLYLLNIFAKAIVSQFINEAGVSPKTADPVGVVASHIFSMADFRWHGITLIDILLAKMHVVCPVLWGIYGSEATTDGKLHLGWWREDKDSPTPSWVSSQRHSERMTGLGAGFAALALRNYDKVKIENPYPSAHYWRAFAAITNVPPALVQPTHFVVLKAMIEGNEQRFIDFYGDAARAAIRRALVEFPRGAREQGVAAKALMGLADVLRREKKLIL